MATHWADGKHRDKNETARLRYRQEVFAKAVAEYQLAEVAGLKFMNTWLRQAVYSPNVQKLHTVAARA